MQFSVYLMTSAQQEDFKAKGKWFLARDVEFINRDEDGDIIDNPNNHHIWGVTTVTNHRIFKNNKQYYPKGYDAFYGWDDDGVRVNCCGLFDDKDEAIKWLKEQYLSDIRSKKSDLEYQLASINSEIDSVMDPDWDGFENEEDEDDE